RRGGGRRTCRRARAPARDRTWRGPGCAARHGAERRWWRAARIRRRAAPSRWWEAPPRGGRRGSGELATGRCANRLVAWCLREQEHLPGIDDVTRLLPEDARHDRLPTGGVDVGAPTFGTNGTLETGETPSFLTRCITKRNQCTFGPGGGFQSALG